MKKFILAGVMALVSFSLSAQIYVGGSVGFGSTSSKPSDSSNSGSTSFVIAPAAMYSLSDDLVVGGRLNLNFGRNFSSTTIAGSTTTTESKVSLFGVNPFGRYTVLTKGPFSLVGEAGVALTFGSPAANTSRFGLNIYASPILTYALTDKINLETTLNVCSFGFSVVSNTMDTGSGKTTSSSSSFTVGVDADNIFYTNIGALTIGLTYKLF